MQIREPDPGFSVSKLVYFIVGMTVALLVFASLAPRIVNALTESAYENNTLVQAIIILVPFAFVAVILLYQLKMIK